MKAVTDAGGGNFHHHGVEVTHHALGRLVAHENGDSGRRGDRLVAAPAARGRIDDGDRIGGKPHHQEADGGVPETDHGPGQGAAEQHQDKGVDEPETAGRKRPGSQRQKGRDG